VTHERMEERMAKLEQESRRFRLVATCLGLAVIAGVIVFVAMSTTGMALAQKPKVVPDIIRAHQFSIVDAEARDRGGLVVMNDGVALLDLFDGYGRERFQVRVTDEGTVLRLLDETGVTRAVIGPGKTEQAGKLTTYTESSIRLADGHGSVVWIAP
jgi:hypothetical protein